MDDSKELLRRAARAAAKLSVLERLQTPFPLLQMADLVRDAAQRIDELEAALRPFANDAAMWKGVADDHRPKYYQLAAPPDNAAFVVGDLRRAAAALCGPEKGE